MVSPEIFEIIKTDFRQTTPFAKFLESKGFKPISLKNGSIIHEFTLGPVSIIKAFRPNLDKESLLEIQEIANKKRNLISKFAPNIDYDEKLTTQNRYKGINSVMSPTKTLIIDLTQDLDNIYNNFSENTRYKINRSIRDNDRIEIIQNPNNYMMDKFYEILAKRQKYKNFGTFSRSEIKNIKNNFWNDSYLISAYTKDNKIAVSNLYIKSRDKVTYLAGSLNSELSKSKAGFQMIFEAIKFFKKIGVKVYDFEGLADERDPVNFKDWGTGFSEFKLKFSQEKIYYPKSIVKYNDFTFRQLVKLFKIDA